MKVHFIQHLISEHQEWRFTRRLKIFLSWLFLLEKGGQLTSSKEERDNYKWWNLGEDGMIWQPYRILLSVKSWGCSLHLFLICAGNVVLRNCSKFWDFFGGVKEDCCKFNLVILSLSSIYWSCLDDIDTCYFHVFKPAKIIDVHKFNTKHLNWKFRPPFFFSLRFTLILFGTMGFYSVFPLLFSYRGYWALQMRLHL